MDNWSTTHGLLLVVVMLCFAGCVSFKTQTLYDGVESAPAPVRVADIALLVEPEIFTDDFTDVWGLEQDACKDITVSERVADEGSKAIHLKWNRRPEACEWAGIGIGWDRYAGKDLSQLIDTAAISMRVKSGAGRMFGLPIVLTLEDYSGGMGFAYTGNKYFERTFIDESWQTVQVPLSAFDMEIENLDPTNIKQLMFELQQSGDIYLDDIKLVFYEEPEIEPWLVEAPRADATEFPIVLFDEGFINGNGWGLMQDDCRRVRLSPKEYFAGERSLEVSWDQQQVCGPIQVGVSWNKWFPVDLTELRGANQVSLRYLSKDVNTSGKILIQLQDYSGVYSQPYELSLNAATNSWEDVAVPISRLLAGINAKDVKQLVFTFEGKGWVYLDVISLEAVAG
jgi:hypothetical protein